MRPPLDVRGGPYRVGVIGDPVTHSLSPALQQPALDAQAIPATYERWPTTAVELPARIERLRERNVLGANVTVPHKVAVVRLVDDLSRDAERAGAVNTVVNLQGRLIGDNTDIHGFRESLSESLSGLTPERAVVLGAGGAARAVVLALEELGVADILIANRSTARAAQLAADLAPAPIRVVALDSESLQRELPRAGVLINATSLGWREGETPIGAELVNLLPIEAQVVDLTYRDTVLLEVARARALRVMDGLAMLVHQGARAFELFTGYPAPLATMQQAVQQARR
jgi:shikimate dehydrogenase